MAIRVFLAEDHGVVRDGLTYLLEAQSDINVVGSAEDGYQAIAQVKIRQPDIVLMDISMPKLNGIEATPRIISASPRTRIIILSMHADAEHIHRALKAGAYGYLLKESAGEEVIAAVRQVYLGRRYLSQKVYAVIADDQAFRLSGEKKDPSMESLSIRELETFQMVVEGKTSLEIAQALNISQKTVETYRSRISEKLGIHDIPGIVKFAIKHGFISIE
jgi:DNA-binding NarL/FixJ family response regulator